MLKPTKPTPHTGGNNGSPTVAANQSGNRPPAEMATVLNKFGENIRLFRQQTALTQEQLAGDCGITAAALHKIEAGKVDVTLNILLSFSQRLGIGINHLLRGI